MAPLTNIAERLKLMSPKQKFALIVSVTLSLTAIILFITWINRADYQVLYSNLSEEDSSQIIQRLKELKVPYRVTPGGIMVPSNKVYSLRLQLAGEGLPQGGAVGFEIFDKTNFAMTDFLQKVNYQRALQGELARTIRSLSEVQQCRVHLSIPEKNLFSEEERPKASVVVQLKPGRRLSQNQIQGIVHLVSSSVEGLDPADVTVIDSRGNLLTSSNGDSLIAATATQLEFQHLVEKHLEERIVNLLEPVVGKNKVKARVSVRIDFTKVETTEEKFDPDSQVVRSEQKRIEKSMKNTPGGVPGVKSNLPTRGISKTSVVPGYSEKKNEVINYEISKIISHQINPPGKIERISAVVLVDGNYTTEGEKGGKYIPRTEEELKKLEDIVKKAVGFDPERGDEVKVINMPFETGTPFEAETVPEEKEILPLVITVAKYALPVLALILLFLFVIRPLMKVLTMPQPPKLKMELPQRVEDVERMMLPEKPSREHILEWARKNPQKAAQLVKNWLEEG